MLSVATTPEEAAQVAEEVKKRNLKVVSVYGGDIPVAKSLEAGIEGLKRLIDSCAACGTMNLLMGGTGNKELYEPYYKAIAECCDYAAAKGMGISVKPHGGLNATGPQCRKTVEFVGNKNFGIWYDPGNIFYYSDGKLNPVDDAPSVNGLVMGMCVKDFKPPKNVDVTPGTGQVDFAAVLAKLKAGGFKSGALVVECLEPGDPAHTLARGQEDAAVPGEADRPDLKRGAGRVRNHTAIAGGRGGGRYHAAHRLSHVRLFQRASEHGRSEPAARQGPRSAAGRHAGRAGLLRHHRPVARGLEAGTRAGRSGRSGIPADNILLAGTHSHTGPLYFDALRDYLHEKAVAQAGQRPVRAEGLPVAAGRRDRPGDQGGRRQDPARAGPGRHRAAAGAVVQSPVPHEGRLGALQSGRAESGHRSGGRAHRPERRHGLLPRCGGKDTLAGLVNFALHLDTTGGTLYAADYPYYVEQNLREKFGQDFVASLRHRHLRRHQPHRRHDQGPAASPRRSARLWPAPLPRHQSKAIAKPSLAVKRAVVEVPMQKFTPAEIEQAKKDMDKIGTADLPFLDQVKAYEIMDVQARGGSTIPLEVQVFRLSDEVAVVGLPGEVFVEHGLAIKKASPFPVTLVIELARTTWPTSRRARPSPKAVTRPSTPASPPAAAK